MQAVAAVRKEHSDTCDAATIVPVRPTESWMSRLVLFQEGFEVLVSSCSQRQGWHLMWQKRNIAR